MVGDWQLELRGLVTGDGTDYDIVAIRGFEDLPGVQASDLDRPFADGGIDGADFGGRRTVDVEWEVWGDTDVDLQAKVEALKTAWLASRFDPVPLTVNVAGRTWLLRGRPRRLDVPVDNRFPFGFAEARARYVANDPRLYGDPVTVELSLPTFVGGFTLPFTVPHTIDASLAEGAGSAGVVNDGDGLAPMTWRIDGPVPRPRVLVVTGDGDVHEVRFLLDVPDGRWLHVDTDSRAVLLDGVDHASRRNQTVWPADDVGLPPGTSTIEFRAADDDAGTLTSTHRHTWGVSAHA